MLEKESHREGDGGRGGGRGDDEATRGHRGGRGDDEATRGGRIAAVAPSPFL